MLKPLPFLSAILALGVHADAGETVIFRGDFDVNGTVEVGTIDLETSVKSVLPLLGISGGNRIDGLAVSPQRNRIVVAGLDSTGTVPIIAVYTADGVGLPSIIYSGAATDNFDDPCWSPDGKWIAFRADLDINGSDSLYVIPEDGSAAPKRLSQAPISSSQDVFNFKWSNDSAEIVFRGDTVTPSDNGLWTVDATALVPVPVTVVANDSTTLFAYDACNQLHFKSNHEGVNRLYTWDGVSAVQIAATSLLHTGGTLEAEIGSFAISSDGLQLAFSSESPSPDLYQVYVMPIGGGVASLLSGVQFSLADVSLRGPNPFMPMQWSPDDSLLAIVADWDTGGVVDNEYSAFILPTSGAPGGVRVMRAGPVNADALGIQFAASGIVVRGDMILNNDTELYATNDLTTPDQLLAPLVIEGVPVSGDIAAFETFLPGVHISVCNGDGGDQLGCMNCPCMNNAPKGTIGGCLNSAGSATRIAATGDTSASTLPGVTTDLRFTLSGAPAGALCVMLSGSAVAPQNVASMCFGLTSGVQSIDRDGLRCAVMSTKRHGGRSANGMGEIADAVGPSRVWGGEAQPNGGLWKQGSFVSGQTRFFQVTYRENSLLGCMRGLNTSQAIGVTFIP